MSDNAIPPRSLSIVHLVFFMVCVLGIVISANYFAMRPEWRTRLDATKTRAYSLSPQTRQLLTDLKGPWTIALIVSENRLDRAMGKQIDEVLARYTAVASNINVTRTDIDDPSTLPQYDQLLGQLQSVYRDQVQAYDSALDEGAESFNALLLFAQQRSAELELLLTKLPAGDTDADLVQKRAGVLGMLADQGGLVIAEVVKTRKMSDARPVPDYDGARSILAQGLSQWALEIDDLAEFFNRTMKRSDVEQSIREYAGAARDEYSTMAERLAASADVLKRLPELELSGIGEQLGAGEAAVIIGPTRAAVIPSTLLFPKSNVRQKLDGGISFDQRFRGEQLLSAAIRSLNVPHMPLVVFLHAEENTLLQRRERKDELVGVTAILRSSRFEVAEWMTAKNGERPKPKPGQKAVFVVVPPPPARSLEPTPAMTALVQTVKQLIAEGQPVLLSIGPSLLPKYGQSDPYSTMASSFGVTADTGLLLLETTPVSEGQSSTTLGQAINDFDSDSAIARAIDGQQTYFGMPIPLRLSAERPSGAKQEIVAAIKADPSRWLEKDWTGDLASREPPPDEARLKEPVPMVIAAERTHPIEDGMQRMIVVGSGGWMASNVADPVVEVGGGRVALVNPGNHELMLASVAWLAGMDDLIAAGPLGQEIPRLRDVTAEDRVLWGWIVIAGVPAACLLLAGIVFLARRR